MFLKQYNYKPRSSSQSSGSEAVADTSASASEAASKTQATAAQGRRRSSATEKFAGLQAYKRGSQDQGAADKRLDQQPGTGVLGNMWNNFTKGSNSNSS